MVNPMTNQTASPPGAESGDMLVIVAAVLILAALAATFILKGRNGFLAAIGGCALAAAALCYTVLVAHPGSRAHRPGSAPWRRVGRRRLDGPDARADRAG